MRRRGELVLVVLHLHRDVGLHWDVPQILLPARVRALLLRQILGVAVVAVEQDAALQLALVYHFDRAVVVRKRVGHNRYFLERNRRIALPRRLRRGLSEH